MARQAGFEICLYNIIGLPHETPGDYKETVALNRRCQPEAHYTGIFFPYAGTELYERCLREGLLKPPPDHRLERRKPVIRNERFTPLQIRLGLILFNYRVYKGNRPAWWVAAKTLLAAVNSAIWLSRALRAMARCPLLRRVRARL